MTPRLLRPSAWVTVACCIAAALIAIAPVHSVVAEQQQVSALFASLFSNPLAPYDAQLRPNLNTTSPVVINTAFRINLLFNVDSKEETFQLDLFVHEWWVDERLKFDEATWPLSNALRLPTKYVPWLPDTFFFNAVKCAAVADSSTTLSADGTVFWSRHQSCTFHSPFDLLDFPFDEQTLAVRRTSFSYTTNELLLKFATPTGWRPEPETDFTNALWDFRYAFSNTTNLVFINTHSANSYIRIARKSTNYILKMILPMLLLVLLSSLSYAIDPSSPPARVGFSVSLILSIVTFNLVVSQDLPKINYATLLDWYVWCCFMFVVLALGEFAAVNNLIVSKRFGPNMPYLVDDFAMWTMPLSWVIFNLCYWPLYNSVGLTLVLVVAWSAWMLLNVYRVRWNHVNNKRGLWEPTKHLYRYLRVRWNAAPVLGDLVQVPDYVSEEDEDDDHTARGERKSATAAAKAAEADHAIQMAATTGANVFEVPKLGAAASSSSSSSSSFDRPPSPSGFAAPSDMHLSASDEPNYFDDSPGVPFATSSASPAAAGFASPSYDEDDPFLDDDGGHAHAAYSRQQQHSPQDEEYTEEEEQAQQNAQDLNLV